MSQTTIYKTIQFEAAHKLPYVGSQHKCSQLHGHSFQVKISVTAPVKTSGSNRGMVCDFADIKSAFQPLFQQLDHRYLNEIEGLENPTSENLAVWIWRRLKPSLEQLSSIEIMETCNSGCIYQQ